MAALDYPQTIEGGPLPFSAWKTSETSDAVAVEPRCARDDGRMIPPSAIWKAESHDAEISTACIACPRAS